MRFVTQIFFGKPNIREEASTWKGKEEACEGKSRSKRPYRMPEIYSIEEREGDEGMGV